MANSKTKFYVDIRGYHGQVTGSCIRNTIHFSDGEKFRFLVDDGVYQGQDETENYHPDLLPYNDSVNPDKIDAVFLTHTHLDHDGALPMFVKQGYNKEIYMSEASSILLPVSLEDCYNVMVSNAKLRKVRPVFSKDDISSVLKQTHSLKFEETYKLNDEEYNDPLKGRIKVTFFNNGHLVGASMILVQIKDAQKDRINLLFTGDYKPDNVFLHLSKIPKWVFQLDNLTIITESTYGTTNSTDIKYDWENNIINSCRKKSVIVIPAFAQGRVQEMLYNVKKLQLKNLISNDYIVEVAGKTGQNYTFKYITESEKLQIKPEMKNFLPNNIHFVDSHSTDPARDIQSNPRIIITTSGMGNFGPANSYIPEVLPNPNAVIHFTGYMAEGTLGRKLLETEFGESVSVKGMEIVRRAQIYTTSEFSSHAKADEIIDFINKFNSKGVLINHGEHDVKAAFAKRVATETTTRRVGILGEKYVYRVDPYGIVDPIEK